MIVFLVEGLQYSGTSEVAERLETLTGLNLVKVEDLTPGITARLKAKVSADKIEDGHLAMWEMIARSIKAHSAGLILHRTNHPYILHRLEERLDLDSIKLLMCECSEYRRFTRRGEVTGDYSLAYEDDDFEIKSIEVLRSHTPFVVETSGTKQEMSRQLEHILFELGIPNIASHIRNKPS